MDAIEALRSRVSVLPRLMDGREPDEADVAELLDLAVCVPDHGMVRPWRFVVIRGSDRERLGEVFAEALKRRMPDAGEEDLAKERARPMRAPVLIAALARVATDRPGVPVVEQLVSAGAAVSNILNGAHAKGLGAVLLTGDNAYDPHVKAFFGLKEEDAIVGFIYLGTPKGKVPGKPRPDAQQFVETFGAHAG
jgi:nitroreductase